MTAWGRSSPGVSLFPSAGTVHCSAADALHQKEKGQEVSQWRELHSEWRSSGAERSWLKGFFFSPWPSDQEPRPFTTPTGSWGTLSLFQQFYDGDDAVVKNTNVMRHLHVSDEHSFFWNDSSDPSYHLFSSLAPTCKLITSTGFHLLLSLTTCSKCVTRMSYRSYSAPWSPECFCVMWWKSHNKINQIKSNQIKMPFMMKFS